MTPTVETVLSLLLVTCSNQVYSRVQELDYTSRLDMSFLKDYFRNDRLVDFQIKCLFGDDQPCDFVGRWIKPRLAGGLLGICQQCSPSQRRTLSAVIEHLQTHRPDVYDQAVKRFLTMDKLLALAKMSQNDQESQFGGEIGRRHIASSASSGNTLMEGKNSSSPTPAPWDIVFFGNGTTPTTLGHSFVFPILPGTQITET